MKTVFKVGMKVYDNIFFPNSKGEVVRIDKHIDCERVIIQFDCLDYELSYTEKGRLTSTYNGATPTLSTKPYTLQGFEQKAPTPTYEEVIKEARSKGDYYYLPDSLEAPSEELADATIALLKLLFLRDYYNEGWQPDWCNQYQEKFCIINFLGEIDLINYSKKSKFEENKFYHVLTFETEEIRDKFLEEQKELLEIAKPLL